MIGRAGIGVDNIDLHTATEKGILVVNAPTGKCIAAAEHTMAHICALTRQVDSFVAILLRLTRLDSLAQHLKANGWESLD